MANTVSFGTAGNERRLTNVAAGINPTDAVNVSQLSSFNSGVQSQLSSLQSQIGDNRTEARRGIAAAVATASAPMPSAPGKTTWQIRGSTFQSEYGFGVGFAHRLHTSMPLNIVAGYGNGGGRNTPPMSVLAVNSDVNAAHHARCCCKTSLGNNQQRFMPRCLLSMAASDERQMRPSRDLAKLAPRQGNDRFLFLPVSGGLHV